MNVLIVHQHFKTPAEGGAIRSYYLATALVSAGIAVKVITVHKGKDYRVADVDGVEVHYLPIEYDNRFGFYRRGLSFVRFLVQAFRLGAKFQDIDICYAISVPLTVGQIALWLKRARKVPFYFEVGDLWPDAPIELGFIKNAALRFSLLQLEKRIYRQASKIIALSRPIAEAIQRKTAIASIVEIPNIADTDFYFPEPKAESLETKFNVRGKFVVSYIGAVGFANGLDYFLECARASLRVGLPVKFLVCGEGALLPSIKAVAEAQQLSNLEFVPFQTRQGVREVLNVTDAAFVCYRPAPILETGSPNKFFDALAAGKMIIINFNGWIREEIEQHQCGIAVNKNQPSDFVRQIEPFLSNDGRLRLYQQNARKLAEEKYSRKLLSHKFINLFKTP